MARYDEMESRWLLPEFMRADALDDAMSRVIDEFGADMSAGTRAYSVWDAIDEMGDEAIDALADELNILWYDRLADVESKRAVVRNCKHLQAKLGTKWGLEQILELYFPGNTRIVEWFEYGGEPGHFRIETELFDEINAAWARFSKLLSQVKRKSQVLDELSAIVSATATAETCAYVQDYREIGIRAER